MTVVFFCCRINKKQTHASIVESISLKLNDGNSYLWSFSGLIVLVLINYFRIIIVNLLASWEIINSVNRIFILATCSHVFAFLLPSGRWEILKLNHNEISCHLRRKTRVRTPTRDNMTTKGTLAHVTTSKLSPGGKRSTICLHGKWQGVIRYLQHQHDQRESHFQRWSFPSL